MIPSFLAECKCGFLVVFAIGRPTPKNRYTFYAPAICLDCGEFFLRNYCSVFIKCPKCRKKAHFYDEPFLQSKEIAVGTVVSWLVDEERRFTLYNKNYLCPKCKRFSMKFFGGGILVD